MASHKYSVKEIGENAARAVGVGMNISTKQAIEICNAIRGKVVDKAIMYLDEVLAMKKAIPFKRFTNGIGHRKGHIANGAFPLNACGEIKRLIQDVRANAQFKGLNGSNLSIVHINAQKGSNSFRYGRQRRRKMKLTTVEIIVEEVAKSDDKKVKNDKAKVKKESITTTKKSEPVKKSTEAKKPVVKKEGSEDNSKKGDNKSADVKQSE